MYTLSKKLLSSYVRSECDRRLRLDLYKDDRLRVSQGMPGKAVDRPGFALIAQQGRDYERAKFSELVAAFPDHVMHGQVKGREGGEETAYGTLDLKACIGDLPPDEHRFLIEAEYPVSDKGRFVEVHKLQSLIQGSRYAPDNDRRSGLRTVRREADKVPGLSVAAVRPDILHVSPPGGVGRQAIETSGRLVSLAADDPRRGLRIVDVKLASDPSPAHYAELAYYGMTLAAWLEDKELTHAFVVLSDAAIWPGRHEASSLARLDRRADDGEDPSFEARLRAFSDDLETMPASVVIGRVKRFLLHDLPKVVKEQDWQKLDWHVDSGCMGCDYLGYDWKRTSDDPVKKAEAELKAEDQNRERMCWPTAEHDGHLSRIAGLSRGACGRLRAAGVTNVEALAALDQDDGVFDAHHRLAAGRTAFRARSAALGAGGRGEVVDVEATSATLPAFSDVDVALSIDYDVGSAITFAIGYQLLVRVPCRTGEGRPSAKVDRHAARSFLVSQRSLAQERRAFLEAMTLLVEDLRGAARQVSDAREAHDLRRDRGPTFQVHVWDRLVLGHLAEVTGRYLDDLLAPSAAGAAPMAWLFPSVHVLADDRLVGTAAPVNVVSEAVGSLVAVDVPHHYSLLGVANAYHDEFYDGKEGKPSFLVSGIFHDPLSDQIPSERGHELWSGSPPGRRHAAGEEAGRRVSSEDHRRSLHNTVATKLRAMHVVVDKLRQDLKGKLRARAPEIEAVLTPPRPLAAVAPDLQVYVRHARLMGAHERLEGDLLMAMPPRQREATFASVRMDGRLTGAEAEGALVDLGLPKLVGNERVYVLRVAARSRQAKVKEGGGRWSLMPEAALKDATTSMARFRADHPELGAVGHFEARQTLRERSEVEVVRLDRERGLVVVKAPDGFVPDMERLGLYDLDLDRSRCAVLDPVVGDAFNPRLRRVVQALGVPPLSMSRPLFRGQEIVNARRAGVRQTSPTPLDEFLWDADTLATAFPSERGKAVLAIADPSGTIFTEAQARAVRTAAGRRLAPLWGPPGTGKTTTSARLLVGLVVDALRRGRTIRIAVTGPTWVAVDTVLARMPALLAEHGVADRCEVARLVPANGRSNHPAELDDHLVRAGDMAALRERLVGKACAVVGGTVYRLNDLASRKVDRRDDRIELIPLYDHMLIDEASQMQVSHAIVVMSGLARDASVTVVGDDLQMPPIQATKPPKGTEHLLGSIFDFYRGYRRSERAGGIVPVMLDTSFRSNEEIVGFVRQAGYGQGLRSHFSGLRMRIASPLPDGRPDDWPDDLPWHDALTAVMDPEEPLVAVVHDDDVSSQRSDGEAALVAACVRLLQGRLLGKGDAPLSDEDLFLHGLGVVTPHRAQQTAVVDRVRPLLTDRDAVKAMANAVDTVERFQGQERTVMFASYGVGDREQVQAEEEFLYSLNRFNVVVSRAKAKMVVLMSRRLVDHLPRDPEVIRQSRLLKAFAAHSRERKPTRFRLRGPDGSMLLEGEVVLPR